MQFWLTMMICGLITPAIMIIGGNMMQKHCPKDINTFIGYRTARSMKNADTWKFAHNYCGKLWQKVGWIMLIPSVIAFILIYNSSEKVTAIAGTITLAVQCVALIATIFPTENALKKTFNDDGTRK